MSLQQTATARDRVCRKRQQDSCFLLKIAQISQFEMPTSKADSSNSFGSSEEEGLTIRVKNEGKAKSTLSPKPILSTGEKDREVSETIHQKSRLSTDSKPRQSNSPRPTVCKNNASSICYNYKPRAVQVAGFGSLDLTPKHVPEIYQKDEYLVDKYKFLKFPSPQPNSILFHSLQGDLLRKRQCIDDVLVVEGNNDNEGLKKCGMYTRLAATI